MAIFASPNIVTDGLVLYVDPGNNKSYVSGSTTITDLSGENNNGTLANGVAYTDDNMGSLIFDGVNDRIECGNFSIPYLTLNTWVYRTKIGNNQGICRKDRSWALSQYNGVLQIAPGTSWSFRNTSYTIPLNTWVNIAYVYRGTGLSDSQSVYINGTRIYNTNIGVGTLPTNTNIVRIGFDDNNWYWGGEISQTQIYNRVLTDVEIKQNFNSLRSRFGL